MFQNLNLIKNFKSMNPDDLENKFSMEAKKFDIIRISLLLIMSLLFAMMWFGVCELIYMGLIKISSKPKIEFRHTQKLLQ